MRKSTAGSVVGLTLCSALLFLNATTAPDYEGVKNGTVSWPLTLIGCTGIKDFKSSCVLDFSGHRGRDSRLLKLEARGVQGSKLFEGRRFFVRSAAEFNARSNTLGGGDQLVLVNGGNWNNAVLRFNGHGTPDEPILIRAQTGVVLSGVSSLIVSGSHVIVKGVEFVNATATDQNLIAIQMGSSSGLCNSCVLTNAKVDNFNRANGELSDTSHHFVAYKGRDITIANSVFKNHRGRGRMITDGGPLSDGASIRLHILKNVFADRPRVTLPSGQDNGFEILKIGGSEAGANPSYSLIENNYVTRADGEIEVMSIKASDVIIRNNTFQDSLGALTLRHSERTLVEGNFFIGSERSNVGGIRVMGQGHVIVNNHFEGLRSNSKPEFYPINLRMADQDEVTNGVAGYSQVRDVLIAHNTFADCGHGIHLSVGPSSVYTLAPQEVSILNNVFYKIAAPNVFRASSPDDFRGFTFSNNMIEASAKSGVPAQQWLNPILDGGMVKAPGDIFRLSSSSAGRGKAYALRSLLRPSDLNGLPVNGPSFNVGNDESGVGQSSLKLRRPAQLALPATQLPASTSSSNPSTGQATLPVRSTNQADSYREFEFRGR